VLKYNRAHFPYAALSYQREHLKVAIFSSVLPNCNFFKNAINLSDEVRMFSSLPCMLVLRPFVVFLLLCCCVLH